jgi:hypothetical protein
MERRGNEAVTHGKNEIEARPPTHYGLSRANGRAVLPVSGAGDV